MWVFITLYFYFWNKHAQDLRPTGGKQNNVSISMSSVPDYQRCETWLPVVLLFLSRHLIGKTLNCYCQLFFSFTSLLLSFFILQWTNRIQHRVSRQALTLTFSRKAFNEKIHRVCFYKKTQLFHPETHLNSIQNHRYLISFYNLLISLSEAMERKTNLTLRGIISKPLNITWNA